ncbi:MAG TPA: alpha/beta hydrolase [Thermoanaerobaculia bacterium]
MLNTTDVGTGVPILWIHGFPLSSRTFEAQQTIPGARHVMPDLPGFGRSEPPAGTVSIEEYARLVIGELDRRDIDQAVFAGLSMGGYVALAATKLAPERVKGLILIDTRETADDDKARAGRYETIEKVRGNGVDVVADSMLPKMLTAAAPAEMRERVRDIMTSSSVEGVTSALRAMAERADATAVLAGVTVPLLVIAGEHDAITPPADAERMAAAVAGAKLVIVPAAAHLSNVEKPEEVNAAIEEFVRGV